MENYETLRKNVTNSYFLKHSYHIPKANPSDKSINLTDKPLKDGFFPLFALNSKTFHMTNS